MRENIYHYFGTQMKRVLRLLPVLLAVTLATTLCLSFCVSLSMRKGSFSERQRKYTVGLVGDITDSYLGIGIFALKSLDDSRFLVDFEAMTEEEARKRFLQGELTAYVRVPDGLVDSLLYGRNDKKISYICEEGQKGIESIFMGTVADVASTLVTRSQSAVYGMQWLLIEQEGRERLSEATDRISLRLIDVVLHRTKLCDLELLGISGGLSMEGYYLCAFLVVVFLFLGIYASPLFLRRNRSFVMLVKAKGVGAFWQVAGEYLSCLCLNLACFCVVFLTALALIGRGTLTVPEWGRDGTRSLAVLFFQMLPVTMMLTAMQFFFYEVTTGAVGSILLQFIGGIAMSYLAGCFYPANFLPDAMRVTGELLPVGAGLRFAQGCVRGELAPTAVLTVAIYLLLFLGLSVRVRRKGMERS